MKPVIAASVYKTLSHLALKQNDPSVDLLSKKLSGARVVDDQAIDPKTVSIDSVVEYLCEPVSRPLKIRIALPDEADLAQGKASVLAPIGSALLGYKESDEFTCDMPAGKKKIRILKVKNRA